MATNLKTALAGLTGDIQIGTDTMYTADKGHAYIETAGENLVQGNVVHYNNLGQVVKTVQGSPDPIGIVYADANSGEDVWIVKTGIAKVLFVGAAVAGQLARTFVAADGDYVTGKAKAENVPTSPFAVDKHFCEIGHVQETIVGAGLAKTNVHFL